MTSTDRTVLHAPSSIPTSAPTPKRWSAAAIAALFEQPLIDLLHHAQQVHRQHSEMVSEVRALGMETCTTLGMLSTAQAHELKHARLDDHNHNLDTSRDFYPRNQLIPIEGTPLEATEPLDPFEVVRTVTVARITMPTSREA